MVNMPPPILRSSAQCNLMQRAVQTNTMQRREELGTPKKTETEVLSEEHSSRQKEIMFVLHTIAECLSALVGKIREWSDISMISGLK